MSVGANGTFAKLITFRTLEARAFAQRHKRTAGPPSAPQIAERGEMREASRQWQLASSAEKLFWRLLADAKRTNAFAIYFTNWKTQAIPHALWDTNTLTPGAIPPISTDGTPVGTPQRPLTGPRSKRRTDCTNAVGGTIARPGILRLAQTSTYPKK
jgi:hypothetical protein